MPLLHNDYKLTLGEEPTASLTMEGYEYILYIDDNESVASTVKDMLECYGYRVHAVMSGEDALKEFQKKQNQFDLVISDFSMPDFNGLDLVRLMKSIRQGIPFIITTGHAENVISKNPKALGIEEIVIKPFKCANLLRTVRSCLG